MQALLSVVGSSSAAPPPSFSPNDLSGGAILWLDALDGGSMTLSGSNVTAMTNKGTNAAKWANAAFNSGFGANGPTLSTINGKQCLFYVRGNQNCLIGDISPPYGGAAMSLYIVCRVQTSGGVYTRLFSCNGTAYNNDYFDSDAIALTDNTATGNATQSVLRGYTPSANLPQAVGVPYLYAMRSYFASGNINNEFTQIVISSGATSTLSPTLIGAAFPNFNINRYAIGCYSGASVEHWDGQIGEVILYKSKLSDTDDTDVRDYLRTKWA